MQDIIELIQELTGQRCDIKKTKSINNLDPFRGNTGIGYSQFNEILLLLGYDRISENFFQFLVDGGFSFKNSKIVSKEKLREGISNFKVFAMFFFGSIRNAYKVLSKRNVKSIKKLNYYLSSTTEIEIDKYSNRHPQVVKLKEIPANQTYLVGEYFKDAIIKSYKKNKNGIKSKNEKKKLDQVQKMAKSNFDSYLASDHIDVYIATSMREKQEFVGVNKLVKKIFGNVELKDMMLRWFDPTQAACNNRVDKGLQEALMLKRARCTIYFAQESETLGKDSELASTLAQGKPVIAFVPIGDDKLLKEYYDNQKEIEPSFNQKKFLIELLQKIKPSLAWSDWEIRKWLNNLRTIKLKDLEKRVVVELKNHYNDRADKLKEKHPLGIQVNLANGVANGLLVVRTVDQCALLVKNILLRKMQFSIRKKIIGNNQYLFLKEKISKSIYRTVTGNELLTNSFWNFYLDSENENNITSQSILGDQDEE